MKRAALSKSILTLALTGLALCCHADDAPKPVVIGYLGGYRGRVIDMSRIAAEKLTHINYAFVNVQNNRAVLSRMRTDTVNLRNLSLLKKRNPSLKLLISIGGWSWSRNFSDAVLTDTSRRAFASSAVAILTKFNLDGIDIDWEYPDMRGDNNIHRSEDKQNYTLMFRELRRQLDSVGAQSHKKLLITAATGGFKDFLNHTEMRQVGQILDYVNLMTYDYFGKGSVAVHQTNLFTTRPDDRDDSADKAVKAYVEAGVPVSKLVMGIAFYGRMFQLKPSATKGLGDSTVLHLRMADYSYIKDSLLTRPGFVKYQDTAARAPYLFNPETHQFLTYEDEWSVENKCNYVLTHKMGGVMFWEFDSDMKNYLLDQINISIKTNNKLLTTKP